jgi:hypothetical protein
LLCAEDKVAGRDVGGDVGEAEVFAEGAEVGHRQLAGTADVHGAEEGDECVHWPKISLLTHGRYIDDSRV